MQRNVIETLVGAIVVAVAVLFLAFAYTNTSMARAGGYQLTARFDRIDGLGVGSDVRISGVKVGSVVAQRLDPQTFLAEVVLDIDPSVQLPRDTIATIASESLLGGRYISLEPGGEEETLPANGRIEYTQSTPSLEALLGQVIFSMTGEKGDAAAP